MRARAGHLKIAQHQIHCGSRQRSLTAPGTAVKVMGTWPAQRNVRSSSKALLA